MNNIKQVQLGWSLYHAEFDGRLALNPPWNGSSSAGVVPPAPSPGGMYSSWIAGRVDILANITMATNPTFIGNGLIGRYVGGVGSFRCPALQLDPARPAPVAVAWTIASGTATTR